MTSTNQCQTPAKPFWENNYFAFSRFLMFFVVALCIKPKDHKKDHKDRAGCR
jgi:hypothetical protein